MQVEIIGLCESTIEIYGKRDKKNSFVINLGNEIYKDDKNPVILKYEKNSTYFVVSKITLPVADFTAYDELTYKIF